MGNFFIGTSIITIYIEKFFKTNKEIVTTQTKNFYDLRATDIEGKEFLFKDLKKFKALLVVNVASQCGLAKG